MDIKGIELSKRFYFEIVNPILCKKFLWFDNRHAGCLIGPGSEVIDCDIKMSQDHDFGPRVLIFLNDEDHRKYSREMMVYLKKELPYDFLGFPTNFGNEDDEGVRLLEKKDEGSVNHRVLFLRLKDFLLSHIGFEEFRKGTIDHIFWLSIPQQRLLTLTRGEVFFDGIDGNPLTCVRKSLEYYPEDVWLYMLFIQLQKITQEEHFQGRSAIVEDEIGSKLIANLLVRYLMELCFYLEKKYISYSKHFGKMFSRLPISEKLQTPLLQVLDGKTWKEREKYLLECYGIVTQKFNELFDTSFESSMQFHSRPFYISCSGKMCEYLEKEKLGKIEWFSSVNSIGNIDQCCHSHTQILELSESFKNYQKLLLKKN